MDAFCARFPSPEAGGRFREACGDHADFPLPGEWSPAIQGVRGSTWIERGFTENTSRLLSHVWRTGAWPWVGNTNDLMPEPPWVLHLRVILRSSVRASACAIIGVDASLSDEAIIPEVVQALRRREDMRAALILKATAETLASSASALRGGQPWPEFGLEDPAYPNDG